VSDPAAAYLTDLSDAEFARLDPLLPPPRAHRTFQTALPPLDLCISKNCPDIRPAGLPRPINCRIAADERSTLQLSGSPG
jgi:hypothetical protein